MNKTIEVEIMPAERWRGGLWVEPALDTGEPDKLKLEAGEVIALQESPEGRRAQVSLGPREKLNAETLRKAGAALARWLSKHQVAQAGLDAKPLLALDLPQAAEHFLEGLLLGGFCFDEHKSAEANGPVRQPVHLAVLGEESLKARLQKVQALVEGVNLARAWSHEPPNILNPATLAERATKLGKELGLKVTVLDDRQLTEMGAGAIAAVGQGSRTGSRLIVLEYAGQGAQAGTQPVVLVGKAITFDTGGYSIKDRTGMVGMKYDKCGGMAVLGVMKAIAGLELAAPVVCIVAAAENMISDSAYRPNDILTTLSGKTVEVISADAEGRLVLSDALTYAQRHYQPQALIDLATLTGGVVVALGHLRAGIMGNDDALSQALFESGQAVHERLWRLPLDDEYFDLIKGDDSDFKNSASRDAHAIVGGIFLKQFVEPGTPWAHIDIAGVATTEKELPYSPKGATGFGVRLLVDYLQKREAQSAEEK